MSLKQVPTIAKGSTKMSSSLSKSASGSKNLRSDTKLGRSVPISSKTKKPIGKALDGLKQTTISWPTVSKAKNKASISAAKPLEEKEISNVTQIEEYIPGFDQEDDSWLLQHAVEAETMGGNKTSTNILGTNNETMITIEPEVPSANPNYNHKSKSISGSKSISKSIQPAISMVKTSLYLCFKSSEAMSMKEGNVPEAISYKVQVSSGGNSTSKATCTKEFDEYFPRTNYDKIGNLIPVSSMSSRSIGSLVMTSGLEEGPMSSSIPRMKSLSQRSSSMTISSKNGGISSSSIVSPSSQLLESGSPSYRILSEKSKSFNQKSNQDSFEKYKKNVSTGDIDVPEGMEKIGKDGGRLGEILGGSTPTRSLALGRCHFMLLVPSENNNKLSSTPRVASPDQICTPARTSSESVEFRGQGPLVQGLTFGDLKMNGKLNVRKVKRKSRILDLHRRQECRELAPEHQPNFKFGKKRKQGIFQEDLMEKNGGIIGMLRDVELISRGVKKIKLDDGFQAFQPDSSGWTLGSF